jgi:hypothetical protein
VVDFNSPDAKTREIVLAKLIKSVWFLEKSKGERFTVILAGEGQPRILPEESFVVPDRQTQEALPALLASVKPVAKPDLLAAMKKAYKLLGAEGRSPEAKGTIYLMTVSDPPDEVVRLVEDKSRQGRPTPIRVFVSLVGPPRMEHFNAESIAAASAGGRCPGVILTAPAYANELAYRPPPYRVAGIDLHADGPSFFYSAAPIRFIYVLDTRMTDETLGRIRADMASSIARIRKPATFSIVATGATEPNVWPGEGFAKPETQDRAEAEKFLAGLRSAANADLASAVRRAISMLEDGGLYDDPDRRLIYILCQSDPPEDVARLAESRSSKDHALGHVSVFIWCPEGAAHPNADRIATALTGRVKVIAPEPQTRPTTPPASEPASR